MYTSAHETHEQAWNQGTQALRNAKRSQKKNEKQFKLIITNLLIINTDASNIA